MGGRALAESSPRVVLLEDHQVVRESLAGFLDASGLQVVGQFGDAEPFLAALPRLRPDVVLVDLVLRKSDGKPGVDGIQVVATVRESFPGIRVLVLTGKDDPQLVRRAIHAGAAGFFSKLTASSEELVLAIRTAARGEPLPQVAVPPAPPEVGLLAQVTDREREVLGCVAAGMDNLKIAALLDITERTVKAHLSNLYRKLGSESRTQLALLARELGIEARE